MSQGFAVEGQGLFPTSLDTLDNAYCLSVVCDTCLHGLFHPVLSSHTGFHSAAGRRSHRVFKDCGMDTIFEGDTTSTSSLVTSQI